MEEGPFLPTIDAHVAEGILDNLLGDADAWLHTPWDSDVDHLQGLSLWAAQAAGTLELIVREVDPRLTSHLKALVRSDESTDWYTAIMEFKEGLSEVFRPYYTPQPNVREWPTTMACPACGSPTRESGFFTPTGVGIFEYVCGCLKTVGTDWCKNSLITTERERAIAWFAKTRAKRGLPAPTICPGRISPAEGVFTFADIDAVLPKSVGDIHDELILTIAAIARQQGAELDPATGQRQSTFGGFLQFSEDDAPIGFTLGWRDLRFHLEELAKEELLESPEDQQGHYDPLPRVRLTLDGWKRVEQLEEGTVDKPNQGFVAMWFADELEPAYRLGIEPAIRAAGYEPMQMSFLEHNDDITDRIVAEIRKSKFVVADFTGNRGGVYFEAGFALGLGKPVVWTCQRKFFEEQGVHFDTQARNHILWDEPEDLKRSLQARIEATIPRGG